MGPAPVYPLGYKTATIGSGRQATGTRRYGSGMDVILIPGFWLGADSWEPVSRALVAAGHRPLALTPHGLESVEVARTVGLNDQVDAVVAMIDELRGPVALVGHSGGGNVAHAAADRRVGRIAHIVYVDTLVPNPGQSINDRLPVVDGVIPLPDWSIFDDNDLRDLDEDLRARFAAMARPEPVGVAQDPVTLEDPHRHDLAATMIACTFTAADLHELIDEGEDFVAETAAMTRLRVVELPTGHWPQFTRPTQLADAITAALADA